MAGKRITKKIRLYDFYIETLIYLGDINIKEGNIEKGLKLLNKGVKIAKQYNDIEMESLGKSFKARALLNLGNMKKGTKLLNELLAREELKKYKEIYGELKQMERKFK